jgi:hypothetical protein
MARRPRDGTPFAELSTFHSCECVPGRFILKDCSRTSRSGGMPCELPTMCHLKLFTGGAHGRGSAVLALPTVHIGQASTLSSLYVQY